MNAPRTLADLILAVVTTSPGVTTNVLCKQVKVRKSDVLVELERLRREQLLRFETGCRGSKCWYLVAGRGNRFLTCSRGMPEVNSGTDGVLAERKGSP